jgi:hypothetical protein
MRKKVENKLNLFLLLLAHIAVETAIIVGMASFVAKKQLILIFISVVGLHYCVSKVTEYLELLMQDEYVEYEKEEEEEDDNG